VNEAGSPISTPVARVETTGAQVDNGVTGGRNNRAINKKGGLL
jgi:hypothetical protein